MNQIDEASSEPKKEEIKGSKAFSSPNGRDELKWSGGAACCQDFVARAAELGGSLHPGRRRAFAPGGRGPRRRVPLVGAARRAVRSRSPRWQGAGLSAPEAEVGLLLRASPQSPGVAAAPAAAAREAATASDLPGPRVGALALAGQVGRGGSQAARPTLDPDPSHAGPVRQGQCSHAPIGPLDGRPGPIDPSPEAPVLKWLWLPRGTLDPS